MWRYPDVSIELKQTEERKLALTDQISFVLVRSYYITLVPSISQTSFYLFGTLRWSADFPLSLTSYEPRTVVTILSQSLLRVQHFSENYLALAWMRQSPKC